MMIVVIGCIGVSSRSTSVRPPMMSRRRLLILLLRTPGGVLSELRRLMTWVRWVMAMLLHHIWSSLSHLPPLPSFLPSAPLPEDIDFAVGDHVASDESGVDEAFFDVLLDRDDDHGGLDGGLVGVDSCVSFFTMEPETHSHIGSCQQTVEDSVELTAVDTPLDYVEEDMPEAEAVIEDILVPSPCLPPSSPL